MTSKLKRRLRVAFVLTFLLALLIPVAWLAAPGLLVVESGLPSAASAASYEARSTNSSFALVVLGGEPWTRPHRAAEIYAEAHPTLVIASGDGDCEDVRRQLESRGVPAGVILTECKSTSTFENAQFSVKLLREHGVRQAVIVTSWYHSRRALACFRKAAPDVTFYSSPTVKPASKSRWPDKYERNRILKEYAKLIYYWGVYGVNPFRAV